MPIIINGAAVGGSGGTTITDTLTLTSNGVEKARIKLVGDGVEMSIKENEVWTPQVVWNPTPTPTPPEEEPT